MLLNADPDEAERLLAAGARRPSTGGWPTYEEMATRGADRFAADAAERTVET